MGLTLHHPINRLEATPAQRAVSKLPLWVLSQYRGSNVSCAESRRLNVQKTFEEHKTWQPRL